MAGNRPLPQHQDEAQLDTAIPNQFAKNQQIHSYLCIEYWVWCCKSSHIGEGRITQPKQDHWIIWVARSSAEAEFKAMILGTYKLVSIKIIFKDLEIKWKSLMKLYYNKSAIVEKNDWFHWYFIWTWYGNLQRKRDIYNKCKIFPIQSASNHDLIRKINAIKSDFSQLSTFSTIEWNTFKWNVLK